MGVPTSDPVAPAPRHWSPAGSRAGASNLKARIQPTEVYAPRPLPQEAPAASRGPRVNRLEDPLFPQWKRVFLGPGMGMPLPSCSPLVGPVLCLPLQESSSAWASQEEGLPSGLWPGVFILLQGHESGIPYKWQKGNAIRKIPNFTAQQLTHHSVCVCVCVCARVHAYTCTCLTFHPPPARSWGVTPNPLLRCHPQWDTSLIWGHEAPALLAAGDDGNVSEHSAPGILGQLLSRVQVFATLWTAARQASLSSTNSRRAFAHPFVVGRTKGVLQLVTGGLMWRVSLLGWSI